MVTNRSFNGGITMMPWSRVGEGWGKEAGAKAIFDYDTPTNFTSKQQAYDTLGKCLVQVMVVNDSSEIPTRESNRTKYLFETQVKSVEQGQPFSFARWQTPPLFRNTSQHRLELFSTPRTGLQFEFPKPSNKADVERWYQLPFLLGPQAQLAFESISDPTADSWQTKKRLWAKMEADVSIRPEARFKHMGETTFIQDNTYEVTDRRGNLLKLSLIHI